MKRDEYINKVVKSFIDSLDEHGTDWKKGWLTTSNGGSFMPINGTTNQEYTGSNVFYLMAMSAAHGFESNKWGTYKQWQAEGKQVPKGAKAAGLVRKFVSRVYEDDAGEGKSYQTFKVFSVFNEEQLEGYEREEVPVKSNDVTLCSDADRWIEGLGADIREGGDRAFYHTESDYINMPPMWKFKDTGDANATQNYYSTLLHEHVHWTGHNSRLDRDLNGNNFSSSYAFEELVAELGSVLLTLQLGLTRRPTPDHAKYINGWKKGLKDQPAALLKAMAQAQKASDWMWSKSQQKIAAE
jgi:antirestriction protein ArdC